MAPRIQITFDCWNVHMQAAWWAERLGYVVEDGHDLVRTLLDSEVITSDDVMTIGGRLAFAMAAAANDPEGKAPRLFFQGVEEKKTAKNRVHLDISRGDRDLEAVVADYVDAGASLTTYGEHPGERWAVMADPEGNEFCIH
jgi:hypothetical protein